MKDKLHNLFYPKSIALIGASNNKDKIGYIILKRLQASGAALYPVNPKEESILGLECYPNPAELPEGIDLAILCIGAKHCVNAAELCAQRGIGFVIIVAGGFSEIGEEGKRIESEFLRIRDQYGTRFLGPNSLGVFLPETGLDTIFVEHGDRSLAGGGKIAFVTQSGSVGTESLGYASNIGFGMRAFVGLGNKCDLNEYDFLHYFKEDQHSNCLAFYCESIERGRDFLELGRETSKVKPFLLLKAGRSAKGIEAVSSHTGRMAGSDRIINGALRQYGIQRAMDDEELADGARALTLLKAPRGNRIAVISAAGGYGVMCTDYIEEHSSRASLTMATLQEETVAKLKEVNLPFASCNNPVDITASADDSIYLGTLDCLLADPGVDMVICISFFAPPAITQGLIQGIAQRRHSQEKPLLVFTQYGPYTDFHLKRFYQNGVPGYPSIQRTVRAARFLAERSMILKEMESQDD